MYETINSPFTIGSVTLKNRIIFAPTSMGLKEEEYLEKLGAIARGGTAMIIIGDVPVLKSPFLSLYSRKRISPLPQDHGNHPPKRCPGRRPAAYVRLAVQPPD